jgi:hypothetical protein
MGRALVVCLVALALGAILVQVSAALVIMAGLVLGVAGAVIWFRARRAGGSWALLTHLIDIGDALQAVSARQLQQRGGWDWGLFDDALAHVERATPGFQEALVAYLTAPGARQAECVAALLAVDRLSAAYTYWTRLFPPRQPAESMFVLSLLQDLSDKVERAIAALNDD